MIQRIQSLYLLLVVVLSGALSYVPLFITETLSAPANPTSSVFLESGISSNILYVVLNSIAGFLAFITILLFKNRRLQIRLSNLNMLIICILTGTIFYFSDQTKTTADAVVHYGYGCYFPLAQLVFTFLAMRAIRKDEALVRSADRLR